MVSAQIVLAVVESARAMGAWLADKGMIAIQASERKRKVVGWLF